MRPGDLDKFKHDAEAMVEKEAQAVIDAHAAPLKVKTGT